MLIIESNPYAAAGLVEALSPIARSVLQVATCAEALQRLDRETELVIVSLSEEGDDALRLVVHCRAHDAHRHLPILLIGEGSELPRLAKGLDLGANDYLVRPVELNELLARCTTQVRRKRLQDRLNQNYERSLSLALTDELTGLYNRRYLFAHLDELIDRANDGGNCAAVWLFDIDHFKRVNDTHGHAAGDEVLREIAARATNSVRSADLVARIGGEEFAVVMPETDLAVAARAAERLRAAIADRPFAARATGAALPVTVSIGVTVTAPAGGDARDQMLKRADEALYAAKAAGRNRVVTRPAVLPPIAIAS
jgi:two-component system cell cycle response regulator